jgi:hypothetical protein
MVGGCDWTSNIGTTDLLVIVFAAFLLWAVGKIRQA